MDEVFQYLLGSENMFKYSNKVNKKNNLSITWPRSERVNTNLTQVINAPKTKSRTNLVWNKCSRWIKSTRGIKIITIIITPFRKSFIWWAPPDVIMFMIRTPTAPCCLPLIICSTSISIWIWSSSPRCPPSCSTTLKVDWCHGYKKVTRDSHWDKSRHQYSKLNFFQGHLLMT